MRKQTPRPPSSGRIQTWVLVALLGLAACKSGTGASPPPSATTTKADFVKRANAICTTMNVKSNALQDPGQDQAKLKQVVDQAIPITTDGLAQLRALPLPKGDEATVRAFYAKVDQLIADLKAESEALQASDLSKAGTIATSIQNDSTAANDAANAYGLNVCGSA
jgi:hypothetical protein